MKYNNSGRTYQVDSIEYDGEVINVFGTSITDMGMGYTVYFNGDEVYFETFDEAYNFAKDNYNVDGTVVESCDLKEGKYINSLFLRALNFAVDKLGKDFDLDTITGIEDRLHDFWYTPLTDKGRQALEDIDVKLTSVHKQLVLSNQIRQKFISLFKDYLNNTLTSISDPNANVDFSIDLDRFKPELYSFAEYYTKDRDEAVQLVDKVADSIMVDLQPIVKQALDDYTNTKHNLTKDNTRDTSVETPLTESNSFEESKNIVNSITPIIKDVFSQSAHIDKDSLYVSTFEEDTVYISFMTDCVGEAASCDVETEVNGERDEDGVASYWTDVTFTGDLEDVTILETSITVVDLKELVKKVNDKLAIENRMIQLNVDDINDKSFEIDHKEYDVESIDDYRLEDKDAGIGHYEYWGASGYDSQPYTVAEDIKWTGKVLASIEVSIIDLVNDKTIEIEHTTNINEASQADAINETDKDYFDKLVAEATPIIERVFDKHPGVSATIIGDTDWKAGTIYVSSIVNCECIGTDYNDDDVDQDDLSASDIRNAQYFEDIDIVKTTLTEDDVDNLIKEVNIELEKANQPIRLTERATEFEYDYGEITLDDVNSYDVEQGDNGIGSYEYWGDVGYDSRPYTYLTDVEFTGTVPVAFDIEVKILR